jgi:hypothetical protein
VYIYTDDDLNRVNRDYLGPKGRRLPWVATYRTYGVTLAVLVAEFAAFMFIGVPLNQWTGLLFCCVAFLSVTYVIRRLNGDVSIVAMFKSGWQEVTVPRPPAARAKARSLRVIVQRFDYDAVPAPRWWQWKARRAVVAARAPIEAKATTAKHRPDRTKKGPRKLTGATSTPATRRAKSDRAKTRKA